jgi:hypothetical protein
MMSPVDEIARVGRCFGMAKLLWRGMPWSPARACERLTLGRGPAAVVVEETGEETDRAGERERRW